MGSSSLLKAVLILGTARGQLRCAPGWGVDENRCELCPAGKYSEEWSEDECSYCPGGSIPDGGVCFPGSEHESTTYNVSESPLHGYYVRQFAGSCYFFAPLSVYWTSAERDCYRLGGHLAVFTSHTEADTLAEIFVKEFDGSDFWIGLNERGNEKAFDWTNPKKCSDYRNWLTTSTAGGTDTREPTEDLEDLSYRCVRSDSSAKLSDENCRSQRRYLCQAPVYEGARSCTKCRVGYYAKSGETECSSCDWGEYADNEGTESCQACPTMSPARLLSKQFGKDGSVQCGGNLGSSQRTAYTTVCVLSALCPILVPIFIWHISYRMARPLAAAGLACWPASNDNLRAKIGAVATLLSFLGTTISGALFASWLKPHHQEPSDWPFKGRRTPTTRLKGCDPVESQIIFFCALFCLIMVGLCFLAVFPIVNLAECCRQISRHMTRKRLTREFQEQTVKFRKERERQQRLLAVAGPNNGSQGSELSRSAHSEEDEMISGKRPCYSFVCTLCGQQRANAINLPCSHSFFCLDCATTFRHENGPLCNACREPSEIHDILMRSHKSASGSEARDRLSDTGDDVAASRRGNAALFGTFERSLSSIELEMTNFNAADATITELTRAVAAAKRVRADVSANFLASTCAGCSRVKDLVIDVPCGHATLCAECSAVFRQKHGNCCSRCAAESTTRTAVNELSCSVCFDVVPANYLVGLGPCGHILCTSCTICYIRSALANVADQVTAKGIRCPLGGVSGAAGATSCPGVVTREVVERVVTRQVRPDMKALVLPLSPEEYERLQRFMHEAAIPKNERFNCCYSDCSRLFAVPFRDLLVQRGAAGADGPEVESLRRGTDRMIAKVRNVMNRRFMHIANETDESLPSHRSGTTSDSDLEDDEIEQARGPRYNSDKFQGDPPFVTCPFCDRQSCVRCKAPEHTLLTCEEYQHGSSHQATNAFVLATSKACPQCHFRITHYHGHACHHIRPGTGCPNCGIHFCISCLRRGTSGSSCGCRLFCDNVGILDNIARTPYPHDQRCGCPICADCRPNQPCSQCNGGCVVCRGTVPPGPKDAREIALWTMTGGNSITEEEQKDI